MSSSDEHGKKMETATHVVGERRARHELREIFENACRVTAPCLSMSLGPGDLPLTTSARRALHDAYPELSMQEVSILFSAVERFHKVKRSQ
jgi:hypothetical protein